MITAYVKADVNQQETKLEIQNLKYNVKQIVYDR